MRLMWGVCVVGSAALLAGWVFASTASAKGGEGKMTVCGASACKNIPRRLMAPIVTAHSTVLTARPPLNSYYTLAPEFPGWPRGWPRYVYVPSLRVVGIRLFESSEEVSWYATNLAQPAYDEVTRGITPFDPPESWRGLEFSPPRDDERPAMSVNGKVALTAAVGFVLFSAALGWVAIARRRRVVPAS